MRPRSALYAYQRDKMIPRMTEQPRVAALVDPGLGKTIATLTALLDQGMPKTLVVAPAMVVKTDVWGREARAWEHTAGVRVQPLVGDPRRRRDMLKVNADVEVVSYENFEWLCDELIIEEEYHAIVFDELSKMKHPGSKRFKRMRTRTPGVENRYGLTGTPVGNHLIDTWGEMYAVALDAPLGPSKALFLAQYFTAIPINEWGAKMYEPIHGASDLIFERIKPWCFSLDTTPADLPRLIPNPIHVPLPASVQKMSDELAHEMRARLQSGEDLVAISAGTRAQKVRQLAGGAVYVREGEWEEVHAEKLTALGELLDELQGSPLLVGYWYRHERERILREFPKARVLDAQAVEDWNEGKVELLLVHPASAGHGINLQYGGHHLCWFTLPHSWELLGQTRGRLVRRGQPSPFVMEHTLCAGAVDVAVMQALHEKMLLEKQLTSTVEI